MDRSDIRYMSDQEIESAISLLYIERASRAMDRSDVDQILQDSFQSGFTITGDPVPPRDVGNGVVAITAVVKDTSTIKHRCHLYTIKEHVEATEEYWIWEGDASSYITSETAKVDKIRRTVALHSLPNEAVIVEHSMVWDGEIHNRKSVKGYTVNHHFDENGEITETDIIKMDNFVARRLPIPSSKEEF